jgi:ssDNA-binding Zn-finger/Zn-ribbon topoisomerase 1
MRQDRQSNAKPILLNNQVEFECSVLEFLGDTMCDIECKKCQSTMRLQSESLTEEFWVCENTECNKWVRRSSIIHEAKKKATSGISLFGKWDTLFSVFNH